MLVCVFFTHFAHGTAGAARIRHFLLPLLSRDDDTQTSGASRRENVDVYLLFEIRIEIPFHHCEQAARHNKTVIARLDRVRCGFSIEHDRLWNTGRPVKPGDDSGG
jgi:hypothetical protein